VSPIEADIIKQKLARTMGGYQPSTWAIPATASSTSDLHRPCQRSTPSTFAATSRELLHGAGGMINSGGASGANDFEEAVVTAVINKRAVDG